MPIITREDHVTTLDLDTAAHEDIYLAAHALIWQAIDPQTFVSYVEAQREADLPVEGSEDERFYSEKAERALDSLAKAGLLDPRVAFSVLDA